ncbi:Ankyrin-1 [Araneus ventricosus]|uniref:Ankyrin-1 n=1 Tax=Araneus ventricosus TaxID=182803 RepID=A0A4Y2MUQ1_ARAVE|nr:Ankyrin-1 [Araneus ventricosus]
MGGVLSVVNYFPIRTHRHLFGYPQKSFTFSSKSKEQLLLEFNALNAVSAKYFYFQILREIKCAVLSNDLDRFKTLSSLLNYVMASKSSEVMQKYERTALEAVGKINLITLASKTAAGKILEYLLSDENVNFVLPFRIDRSDLSPEEEDDECHNAFYYAIRSSERRLIEILIDKWPNSYLSDTQKLDDILSKAFNELSVRNIPLKKDMELYVEKKLVDLRFFDNSTSQVNDSIDLLMLRIEFVRETISFVVTNYCDNTNELDEQFTLAAKYIAQNIHTMKSQLSSIFEGLPLEEIEFCLIFFIRFCLKAFCYESMYYFVLSKQSLLSHLEKFSKILECVKEELKTIDISRKRKEKITLIEVTEKDEGNLFEDLYKDFRAIRDLYTLEKIKKYTDVALSANPRNREGHIVITRALQVMGEHFNSTPSSSKLSDSAVNFILPSISKNLADIITSLRNSLSHLKAFCLRYEIEENANTFFADIQSDIAKISKAVFDILYTKKIKLIVDLLNVMARNTSRDSRIFFEQNHTWLMSFTKVLEEAKHLNLGEIGLLEKLVLNLEAELDKEINHSKQMFHRLGDAIEASTHQMSPRHSSDVTTKLRDSLFSRDTKEMIVYLQHVLLNDYSTSLLKENKHFVTDGKIDTDKVTKIMENIFVKISLRENKAMLNKIKERDAINKWKVFPRDLCDDLLQKFPDEMEIANDCKPEQIKMVSKLVSDVDAVIQSKSQSEIERLRRILSTIADKKTKLKNVYEELSETLKCSFEMIHTTEKYYSSTTMVRDIYEFQKKLESLNQAMDLKSFSDELYLVFESISSRMLLEHCVGGAALENALSDIFDFVIFRKDDIKWIKEFRHMIHSNKAKTYTFTKNVYSLKPDYAQQLSLKISLLRSVLKNHNLESLPSKELQACEQNLELQSLIEMLVLDILSAIEGLPKQLTHINFYLDSYYPTAYGRNLRNHIAHGNALVEMLLGENFANVLLNAQKIIEVKDIFQEKLGKKVENDPVKSKKSHDIDLAIMKKQKQFFASLAEGIDEKGLKNFISEGVDIYGRDLNSRTALHFAARAPNPEILKFLLKFNLDINAEDDIHQTALHAAVNSGRGRNVKYLVEELNMAVNGKDINGQTPLHIAAKTGNEGIVRLLLKHKRAKTFFKDVFGYTPLHHAVLENHFNVLTVLLENEPDVDANQTFYGFTALHLAAAEEHLNLVNSLIEKGAKVNFKSDMDFTPLHHAAKGGHSDIVKYLLMKGADVNAKTVQGLTPLHLAAESGDVPTIAALLQHGAEGNAKYLMGITPSHFAAGYGCLAALQLLVEKGADVAMPAEDGSTPLVTAADAGHYELVKELLEGADTSSKVLALQRAASRGNLAVMELLFDSGADIKLLLDSTALHFAAEEGRTDTVKFLLKRGADINAQDSNGDTALHLSASKKQKEVVQLLIERKADILIKNNTGTIPLEIIIKNGLTDFLIKEEVAIDFSFANDVSPFHLGAVYGDINFVNYCIQKGCHVDIRIKSGSTALHLATMSGREEVIKSLLKNGSDIDAEDRKGFTALNHAVNANNEKILQLLIDEGANLNAAKERSLFLSAVTQGHEDIVDVFLSRNQNVGAANPQSGGYPLHTAVFYGHVSVVSKMLEKGNKDEINVIDDNCQTPLQVAVEKDHREIAQLLLRKGADPGISLEYWEFPLLLAIAKGSSKMVEILLQPDADYLVKDNIVKTFTVYEIESGHSNAADAQLQNPAIYNIKDQKENSLMHVAASSGSLEIIKFLIHKNADINSRDSSGAKPIHIAAKEGYRDVLDYFLNLGISIDETGENGWTLMHYAAAGNHSEICKFLSERGADVNAINLDGATPLHVAAEMGNLDVFLSLLEIGAFYDARDGNGKTPQQVTKSWNMRIIITLLFASNMFSAVQNNNRFRLESILTTGLDVLEFNFVNVKNAKNVASIHYAAKKGYERIVEILLTYRANPNLRTERSWTSLHCAAKGSHFGIVKDLLCNGAVFEAISDSGDTPLQYSTDGYIVAILELLKNSFCKIENKDHSSLGDLKAIEDMDIAKAVVRAKNLQNRTLTTVAIVNGHPDIDELKEIFQTDVLIPLKMAEMFYRHGNNEASLNLYKAVLQKRISIFGQDDPAVLDIQKLIASLLVHHGDYTGALNLAQKVYETLKSIFGDRNRETLLVKYLIALTLECIGQKQQSLKTYEEVSEIQRKVLGLNHTETLATLTSMAELLYKENKFEMALKVNEEIFKTLTEDFEINPWILRVQTSIATILRKQKKFSEALKLFRNILETKERIFGFQDQETLETSTEVAVTLFCMGQEEESLELLRNNVELQFNLLGPNHPITLRSRRFIANILYSQRKFREALDIYTKDLNARILILGANHPSIEKTRNRIDFINSHIRNPVLRI